MMKQFLTFYTDPFDEVEDGRESPYDSDCLDEEEREDEGVKWVLEVIQEWVRILFNCILEDS